MELMKGVVEVPPRRGRLVRARRGLGEVREGPRSVGGIWEKGGRAGTGRERKAHGLHFASS